MSMPVGSIVKGGIYEGVSGQQRLVTRVDWRIIDYWVQYYVVKQGVPPENQVPGTYGATKRKTFAAWAIKKVN